MACDKTHVCMGTLGFSPAPNQTAPHPPTMRGPLNPLPSASTHTPSHTRTQTHKPSPCLECFGVSGPRQTRSQESNHKSRQRATTERDGAQRATLEQRTQGEPGNPDGTRTMQPALVSIRRWALLCPSVSPCQPAQLHGSEPVFGCPFNTTVPHGEHVPNLLMCGTRLFCTLVGGVAESKASEDATVVGADDLVGTC